MSEVNLWKWLKPYCPQGRYSRVETPDTAPGFPDVNYRIMNAEGHMELKDARRPNAEVPFPNDKIGLHRSQLLWIADQLFFNGIVWVVARVGDKIFWVPGKNAGAFNGATQKRLAAHSHYVQSGRADVRKIKRMLEGEGQ